ncbi:MAG TPA: PadR family transcriptional regulator [Solirubrobacteraceae bacterium]
MPKTASRKPAPSTDSAPAGPREAAASPRAAGEQLNQTARVLLGMIAEGHRTGYAIKAEIERSTRLYWGASVGGIYPELRRLREAGLVSVRDDPRGGATRHAYTLTREGRAALTCWLTDSSEPVLEMRHEALLRLRFAGVLEPQQQVEVVRRMRAVHERRLAELSALIEMGEFDDPLHRMTVEFGTGWNEWAIGWCNDTERRLRDG